MDISSSIIGILLLGGVGGGLIVYDFPIQDGRFAGILYMVGAVILTISLLYIINREENEEEEKKKASKTKS